MKKALKVLGIIALTFVGLLGIGLIHFGVTSARVPVELMGDGNVRVNSWDKGYVHAKGTWVIDGERPASPLNIADITCFRDDKTCYVASADITDISGLTLNAEGDFLPIKRWDASTIEYTSDALCTTYAYVIDRATQKLIGRRLKKKDVAESVCDIASADLRLTFVNGFDVVQQLRRERAPNLISIAVATAFILLMLAWAWRVIRKA